MIKSSENRKLNELQQKMPVSEPIEGRPVGTIEVLRELSHIEEDINSSYSFEKAFVKVELVRTAVQYFLRKTDYSCSAEKGYFIIELECF